MRQLRHGWRSRSVLGPTCPLAVVIRGDLPFHALSCAAAAPLPSPDGVGSGPGARLLACVFLSGVSDVWLLAPSNPRPGRCAVRRFGASAPSCLGLGFFSSASVVLAADARSSPSPALGFNAEKTTCYAVHQ